MVMGQEGRWVRILSCPVSCDPERVARSRQGMVRQGKTRCGKETRGVYGFQVDKKTHGILTLSLTSTCIYIWAPKTKIWPIWYLGDLRCPKYP